MSDKLNIANEMNVFDRKDRTFYDNLTDEERKKFSTFLMIRWGSSINGSRELQEYYVQSTNHYLNKHFFALSRHPKLQWLMATAVSPGMGSLKHNWISLKKRESSNRATVKQLEQWYPDLKADELELLASINTKKDIDQESKLRGET
jgi:hypothetical protein